MRAALAALARLGPLRASSLWRSEPLGDPAQPWYVNAVAELAASGDPHALLRELRALERAAGRPDARPKNEPRALDLDLLLYGERVVRTADLLVPHPGLTRRRFVLAPLAELAPELVPPGETRSIAALLRDLDDPGRVEKLMPVSEDPR